MSKGGIDDVLDKIKEAYTRQSSVVDASIAALEQRLKDYKEAAKLDLLAEYLERNGLPSGGRRSETAALALYEALSDLPEFKPIVVEVDEPGEEPPNTIPTLPLWPALTAASKERPVVLFGGVAQDDKVAGLQDWGLNVDWISNSTGTKSSSAGQRTAARIRTGSYVGVVVLNELVGHDESAIILAACRANGTLYAMGKKGGVGKLRLIFDEFNKRLEKQ